MCALNKCASYLPIFLYVDINKKKKNIIVNREIPKQRINYLNVEYMFHIQ